jgi:DNA-binding transcriptional LysR family regulator
MKKPQAPKLSLAQLRIFLAALEQGSVTNAAADLEMSQSAVSHALSELERLLGSKLLLRGRFGTSATVLGERVALHARQMLRSEAAIFEEAKLEQGALHGTLKIATLRSIATHILPDLIGAFGKLHPKVRFQIQSGEGVADGAENAVRTARADLGFLAEPVGQDLEATPFLLDEWVVAFPAHHAPKTANATFAQMLELPFLLCNEAGAPTVRQYFAKHHQVLTPAAQVEDDSVILSMVAHGFGVSVLPRLATLPVPDDVVLRGLPESLERQIVVAVCHGQHGRLLEAFLGFVASQTGFVASQTK